MAYALTLVFEGLDEADYWSVNEKLGIGQDGRGDYPAGLLVHTAGPSPAGWVVTEVWDDQASHEAFRVGRLGAALEATGVAPPTQVIDASSVNFQRLG
ncbi:MAG: hypothetical protein R2726_14580 [Acidimicrobiales bacterium]